MRILFCNVGWMENYDGLNTGDKIKGGGKYVHENKRGFEICNFSKSKNNKVFGYVQPMKGTINIEKLGAEKNDDYIDDVLVIWTANRKGRGTVVIGWYKNAKVYRKFQEFKTIPKIQKQNDVSGYYIEADYKDTYLLTFDERMLSVPRGKNQQGSMGQSNVWYADKDVGLDFRKKVIGIIESKTKPKKIPNVKIIDIEKKSQVEKIAIEEAGSYYASLGYSIRSVENENVGYDLVAKIDEIELLIEVKGLSGKAKTIGLTPNEFKFFQEKNKYYRLFIVNNALTNPTNTICRYSEEQKAWVTEGIEPSEINITPKESAIIKIN